MNSKKTICALALCIVAVCTPAWGLQLPFGEAAKIRRQLDKLGLTDYVLDLNVSVPVPAVYDSPSLNLWATVIRPEPDKKLPTILLATAYRRENMLSLGKKLLLHGYNLMLLDLRGTGSSEGKWGSFDLAEQYDTAYVIDHWIPEQSWSDGRVGMIGPSYCGIIQLFAAGLVDVDNETGEPEHLKAILASEVLSDAYRDIVMQGGNFNIGFIPLWINEVNSGAVEPPLILEDAGFPADPEVIRQAEAIVQDHREQVAVTAGWIADYGHAGDGFFYDVRSPMIYWPDKPAAGWSFDEGIRTIPAKLPVMLSTGWFDIFLRGTLNNYTYGLAEHDTADKPLIIGQWYHGDGAFLNGIDAFTSGDAQARWFDWNIKQEGTPLMTDFPVLMYVMGKERWRAEKSWPLPSSRLQQQTLFLSKEKPSNIPGDWFSILNRNNNFLLSSDAGAVDSAGENPVLTHNPENLHGRQSRSEVRWSGSMYTTSADKYLDERADELGALTFTTEPLTADLEITGPLLLTFRARTEFGRPLEQQAVHKILTMIKKLIGTDSNLMLDLMDREDVQWVVELNDVFPDGQAKNITSGWLSAWHRPYDPAEAQEAINQDLDPAYTPFDPFYDMPDKQPLAIQQGQVYAYAIELWPAGNVFKAGHLIRISISGSDFPHLLPVLRPSASTLVIEAEHPAQLDFTTVNTAHEGIDWRWVDDVDTYLLEE